VVNPFQVTKPVDPSEVIDREAEDAKLRALAEEGNNARLVAPRRYGKTSLLRRAQARLSDDDWLTVYVDLLGIVTMDDFAARIERAYVSQLKGTVAKWFIALRRTLKPTLTLGGARYRRQVQSIYRAEPKRH
jgi:AAA+ ATPase superfamily predicted ATPase